MLACTLHAYGHPMKELFNIYYIYDRYMNENGYDNQNETDDRKLRRVQKKFNPNTDATETSAAKLEQTESNERLIS